MRYRNGSQEHTEVCGVCVWCPTSAESVRAPRLMKGSVAPRARQQTTNFRNFGCAAFSDSRRACLKTITWEIQKVRKLVQSCGEERGRQPPAWVREVKEA